jgi:hypothetical protein
VRSRTAYCPHGFQVPGPPEPWLTKLKLKASRFCPDCWNQHRQKFEFEGYSLALQKDSSEDGNESNCYHLRMRLHDGQMSCVDCGSAIDACGYGYLRLIHFAISQRGWHRDQDKFEFLELECRMHLLEKRALFAGKPDSYIRAALNNLLQDLQRDDASEHQIEKYSVRAGENTEDGSPDFDNEEFDPDDESQNSALIVDAMSAMMPGATLNTARRDAAKQLGGSLVLRGDIPFTETKDLESPVSEPFEPTPRKATKKPSKRITKQQENSQLVAAAIAEQSHRIDQLAAVQKTDSLSKFHDAVNKLSADEQRVIKLRFYEGERLCADRLPRSRADIVRELRTTSLGGEVWSEWDLRALEQTAMFRIRGLLNGKPLPKVLQNRDD